MVSVTGLVRCPRCKKPKAPSAFGERSSTPTGMSRWCLSCQRLNSAEYRQTETYRRWVHDYVRNPERLARNRERNRARTPEQIERRRQERRTPLGKCKTCLWALRARLRRATDPAKRQRILELMAAYEAEIRRIRTQLGDTADGTAA